MSTTCAQNGTAPWVKGVPSHWQVQKLKSFADIRFSNVDKLINEGEEPIRLCNYTDVYYQNEITGDLDFMKATATPGEIKKFALLAGDIIITKDSEVATDIAVPTFVPAELPGVICGYHLAQVRPREHSVNGKFLFYAFSAHGVRDHFHVSANGITRYGLSQHDIKSALFPLPPRKEQDTIVAFLDCKLEKIDRFIANKRRLIELLEEERQGLVESIILGQTAKGSQKPSELMFLDTIPATWDEKRAKYFLREIDIRSESGDEELLSVSHITGVTPRSQKNITMFKAESYEGYKLCFPGDLVVNTMWAFMAALGISQHTGIVSSSYAVYRQHSDRQFEDLFLDALLRTRPYKAEYLCRSTGIRESRLRLYPDQLLKIPLLCPPRDEQRRIVETVEEESSEIRSATTIAEHEIELMSEFRTSLIAEAVTGKIDVKSKSGGSYVSN